MPLRVGCRVEVEGQGRGLLAVDNEDGTWNIDFNDGTEGDVSADLIGILQDQSVDSLYRPVNTVRNSPTGVRVVINPSEESKPDGWTRFVCFSDTHGLHRGIPSANCPAGDVLLHAGDFTNTGELEQVSDFSKWLEEYPAEHKIVIAGNHDITFHEEYYLQSGSARFHKDAPYDCKAAKQRLTGCVYLEDSAVEVCGYQIFGSPWQPEFCDWAFNLPRGEECRKCWEAIPEYVDILITHTPAKGHCDMCSAGAGVGCEDLRRAIERRGIPVSVAGHIHNGYGCCSDDVTLYINASTCTSDYRPTNAPIVFDVPPRETLRTAMSSALAQRSGAQNRINGGCQVADVARLDV